MGNVILSQRQLRVMVLGGAGVGKTTLVRSFLNLSKTVKCKSSLFQDVYRCRYKSGMRTVKLEVIDVSGDDIEESPTRQMMASADAFILLHSKNDNGSYEKLKSIKSEIQRATQKPEVTVFVVGASSEMMEGMRGSESEVVVEVPERITTEYREVCVMDGDRVRKLFADVIDKSLTVSRSRFC